MFLTRLPFGQRRTSTIGIAALLTAAWLSGCRPTPAVPTTSAPAASGTATTGPSATTSNAQCQDLLQSALNMFQLQDLGISTEIEQGISILNQWQRLCMQQVGDRFPLDPAEEKVLDQHLSDTQLADLQRALYEKADGEHLRNCLLFRAVQEHAIGNATGDLPRAIRLFEHVTRNIDLLTEHPDGVPLSPFEIYMLGQGTAEDRAWFFIELLRQLKIDAVVLIPGDAPVEGEDRPPLLVGVLLEAGIYLFDPQLGRPLTAPPGAAASKAGVLPATLAQLQANPELVRQYDAEKQPYPFDAATIAKLRAAVVGYTCVWAPRMDVLQAAFTGPRATVIYDGLTDRKDQRGSLSRIAAAPQLKGMKLEIWDYPDQQLTAYANMDAQQGQVMLRLTDPWKAPLVPREVKGEVVVSFERSHFRARLAQARGKFEDAIKNYTLVQIRGRIPSGVQVDPRIRQIHARAAEDATFWMGVCKLEQGRGPDRKVAADKFRQYLKEHPEGVWATASRGLLAQLLADDKDLPAARALLAEIPPEHPQYLGYRYQLKLWEAPPE